MPKHTELGVSPATERALEILPGFLTWGFLLLLVVLSFVNVEIVAYVVVAFAVLWLFKILGYSRRLVSGYRLMRVLKNITWRDRLEDLRDPEAAFVNVNKQLQGSKNNRSGAHQALRRYRNLLLRAKNHPDIMNPDDALHVVIIAAYNEQRNVIEPTIQAVRDSAYDVKNQVMLVLAYEERGGAEIDATSKTLIEEYGHYFKHAQAIKHPADMPGEAKAKAGNITFAARKVTEYVHEHNIDPAKVIVTTLDSDNRPSNDYLAYLTYIYCVSKDREKKAYQPMAMFFNNIWDAPALSRVIATSNSFWLLMEAMRPHRLRNFSAHAQSLQGLIDADYWNVRSIVEDGHQYWRMYFTYDGQYTVVPLYTAIYQDAVLADGYLNTFKAQFKQLRRWAYGVSDTPFVLVQSYRDRAIPWSKKLVQIFRQMEGYFSWAVAPLVLAVGGWIPLVASAFGSQDIQVHLLPTLTGNIMTISLIGLLGPIIASIKSLPPKPEGYSWFTSVMMFLQWFLVPVSLICFGSFAAINAQTRLMLGKYLEEFDVTEKKRKSKPTESSL